MSNTNDRAAALASLAQFNLYVEECAHDKRFLRAVGLPPGMCPTNMMSVDEFHAWMVAHRDLIRAELTGKATAPVSPYAAFRPPHVGHIGHVAKL
jgi:hypothetical protein